MSDPGHSLKTVREELARTPWWVISLVAHGLLWWLIHSWVFHQASTSKTLILTATPVETYDPPPPLEPLPDLVEEDVVTPLEDPLVVEDPLPEAPEEVVEPEPLGGPFDEFAALDRIVGTRAGSGPGFDGKFSGRGTRSGGSRRTQAAVEAGLDWLARHQHRDGHWDSSGFETHCIKRGVPSSRGRAGHDVGVTGLALLAFLGAGNTMDFGSHRDTVHRGMRWLIGQQAKDGCFGPKSGTHFLYGHALATLATIEGYHLGKQPLLQEPAQRGLDFVARSRNPYAAWRYAYPPNGDNDVSVTGWMLFALFAGRDAGLTIDGRALRTGLAYLDHMTGPQSHLTGYASREVSHHGESMTAVHCLLRAFQGERVTRSPALKGAAERLLEQLPSWSDQDFYYWYYATYAMWQCSGKYWLKWQRPLVETLVRNQRKGTGCERGSWDPQGATWGPHGGRIYTTALGTLCLEVYYRYDRVKGAR